MEITISDVIAVVDHPLQCDKLLKYSVVISANDFTGLCTNIMDYN